MTARAELVKRLREDADSTIYGGRTLANRADLREAADALEADAGVREQLVDALEEMVRSAPHTMRGTPRFNKAWHAARAALSAVRET